MTLFGEEPAPARKVRKPRASNADAVLEIDRTYEELFEQRWNFKPKRNFGRDRKHFSELERQWGKDDVLALLRLFFETTDPKVVRSDYGIPAFYSLAQHLKLIGRRVADERTLANLDAAARATGRRSA